MNDCTVEDANTGLTDSGADFLSDRSDYLQSFSTFGSRFCNGTIFVSLKKIIHFLG